jgi:hypothetical protein
MIKQITNFITTPNGELNENFELPTKHGILQFIEQEFGSSKIQVRKFSIVTSYCFLLVGALDKMLLNHPYSKAKTSNGELTIIYRR